MGMAGSVSAGSARVKGRARSWWDYDDSTCRQSHRDAVAELFFGKGPGEGSGSEGVEGELSYDAGMGGVARVGWSLGVGGVGGLEAGGIPAQPQDPPCFNGAAVRMR
ncbi:hypothetical protein NDU88_005617 [Pleurodeles waltl]|uniref:Uncharacterized protein n=1 Tax=Pleurodeles waltl TaxID=8319 RepID=A0AAV7VM76_PLEWA|nr:hypothetical protein NDU88_005617 [Pleurodeles waltl]